MSTASAPPAGPVPVEDEPRGTLGLGPATALIVGSIIGVGIFNLPASLAGYGPISLVAMALTTIAALPDQAVIQYSQALEKPARLPKAARA